MVTKMERIEIKVFQFILLLFVIISCQPDRSPTEPVPIDRPNFLSFGSIGNANLVVPLNEPIVMYFDWPMDLQTFPSNFTVESVDGKINGSFSYGNADSIVVFKPETNYNPAEVYDVTVYGGVRNKNGMSMTSPNDEVEIQSTKFFTTGQYATNGFPYVFVRDKTSKQVIYRVGNLNEYIDSLYVVASQEDFQTAAIEFSPNGNYLYMVNLKATEGTVTVIDPVTFNVFGTIGVGLGPTNIGFGGNYGYVTNNSEKSFTKIDLNASSAIETYIFSDGFKPKDIVYSQLTNKLYFYSSTNTEIKVVDADNYSNNYILNNILSTKAVDIEITNDGKFIYLLESSSDRVVVFNTSTEMTETVIETGYSFVVDGVMGDQYYYVAFFRGVSNNNVGGVLKIANSSHSILDVMTWDYEIDQLGLTAAEELLYTVVPGDTTVKVIETSSLQNITSTKVNGSLKYITVSKQNY
jgi:YVTN family beta-propeller protein